MPPRPENQDALARWTSHALSQLPDRTAPPSLLPRILAAVAEIQSRPWYRRAWTHWPDRFRWFTTFVLAAAAAAVLWQLSVHAPPSPALLAGVDARVEARLRPASALANATSLVVRSVSAALAQVHWAPWTLAALAASFAVLVGGSLGLGAACWRLAEGREV